MKKYFIYILETSENVVEHRILIPCGEAVPSGKEGIRKILMDDPKGTPRFRGNDIMGFFRSLLLLIPIITFYSCTASDVEITPDITFEELKARVNENSNKLFSLEADGEISIDSPTLSNTGSITVSIFKPDSVYTKLEGPFGIDVADLLITRNNFVYYNAQENRVIRGPSTPQNLGLIMRIKVSFDEIINAFSGKFTFNDETYKDVNISTADGSYIVTLNSDAEKKKYWIDSRNYYVTKIGTYDAVDNPKVEILYSNFYEKDGIYFPKNININRPKEKQNIWLNYFREEFNNGKLTYRLKIPKSAKQINW